MARSNAYNARHILARDVARTFVIPKDFIAIATFENTLLIGPRGSGKTTILKTLTPSGLHHLFQRTDIGDALSNLSVEYLPIYIPAETSWKGDAQAIRDAIRAESDRNHILNGLFVDHSLRWLVLALEEARKCAEHYEEDSLPGWAIPISDDQEGTISRLLSSLWQLDRIQTSFIGLKLALIERSNSFRAPITSKSSVTLKRALSLPVLDILQMFRGVIEIIQEIKPDTAWSFNFDEMEIAPKHVVSMLYENLRSWDQRAVLKFSLYPYVDFYNMEEKLKNAEKGPVEGPDYQAFSLTNDFAKSSNPFTQQLVDAECVKRKSSAFELARYLNSSEAIQRDTRKFDGLKTERNFEAIFRYPFAKKNDPSIVEFLEKRGFTSLEKLISVAGENKRAQHIRKIAPICEFRNYYLSEHRIGKNRTSGRTSPKGFGYYHGYERILSLTEGNPRSIKFYINDLLDGLEASEKPSVVQNRVIRRNVDRFRALVASKVVPIEGKGEALENSLSFADRLGKIFVQEILSEKFKAEPRLSAVFRDLHEQKKRVVEVAVNSGALVVDRSKNESKLVFDVENQRMRLSHSFAPYHPLPTITGQPMPLSDVPSVDAFFQDQSDLFRWTD